MGNFSSLRHVSQEEKSSFEAKTLDREADGSGAWFSQEGQCEKNLQADSVHTRQRTKSARMDRCVTDTV
jgi:hypothetical protein